MTPQNKMESNKIGIQDHWFKIRLNMITQVKDKFGDAQRFCDECLLTHFFVQLSQQPRHNHTQGKEKPPIHAVNVTPLSVEMKK